MTKLLSLYGVKLKDALTVALNTPLPAAETKKVKAKPKKAAKARKR